MMKRDRKSFKSGVTCSSSKPTHTVHVRPDERSRRPEHHYHTSHPASSTQTESLARSGVKRKAADDDDVLSGRRTSDLRSFIDRKRYRVSSGERRRTGES